MTKNDIKNIVEKLTGLDISKRIREHAYIKARCIYFKVCVDVLDSPNYTDISSLVGLDHATMTNSINSTFKAWISNDAFAELWIMANDEAMILKKLNDKGINCDINNILPIDVIDWISGLDPEGLALLKIRLRAIMNNSKQ